MNARPIRLFAAVALALGTIKTAEAEAEAQAQPASTLANATITEPSHLAPFAVSQLVADAGTGTGPSSYWKTITPSLQTNLQFTYLTTDSTKTEASQYGIIDFTATASGPLWMLTTDRYGGGGNSGTWSSQVSTPATLVTSGWSMIGQGIVQDEYTYNGAGAPDATAISWDLWQRTVQVGNQFSIRTEKYQSPIILSGQALAIPEPLIGSWFAAFLLYRRRTRQTSHSQ